jgi:hypothetical protein
MIFAQGQYLEDPVTGHRWFSLPAQGLDSENFNGSPYLQDDFVLARLEGIEKLQLIRFNAFNHTVELKRPDGNVIALSGPEKKRIELQQEPRKIYILDTYLTDEGEREFGFFELIHEDKAFELYLRERVEFKKGEKAQAYVEAKPDRFEQARPIYYFRTPKGQRLIEISKRKKEVLELFPEQSRKELKKYMKEQRLKIDEADGLRTLFSFYFGASQN